MIVGSSGMLNVDAWFHLRYKFLRIFDTNIAHIVCDNLDQCVAQYTNL